ncbi:hypothetical protein AAG906_037502 [Vitis piasezkii]
MVPIHHSLPPTILSPSKTSKILNIPSLQSIFPISPNCHPLIISHGAFKSNIFLKVMIFITSLMTHILHHHPPSPSLVLHPQIRHTQSRSVRIILSLVLSLVLSPFHYNHLLPTPPLSLMHVDDEDLIDRVLEGLSDEYKYVIDAINTRDTSISFAELHEKLLNKEASLQTAQPSPLSLPAMANSTAFWNHPNWHPPATTPQQLGPTTVFSPHDQRQPKPYLGHYQACGIQGHTAKRCPMFRLVTNQQSPTSPNHVVLGNNTTPTLVAG